MDMQSHSLKHKRAFTLIEVVVVGSLAALLGVGLVGILQWFFGTSQEDLKRSHLQTQSNIVLEEISRQVHVSSRVATPVAHTLVYYTGGVYQGNFTFANDTLKQNNVPFVIAGHTVLVKSDSSYFIADTSGAFVNSHLVLRQENARFILHTGIIRCRN
jgi:Tfp pilus assembly protein PilV